VTGKWLAFFTVYVHLRHTFPTLIVLHYIYVHLCHTFPTFIVLHYVHLRNTFPTFVVLHYVHLRNTFPFFCCSAQCAPTTHTLRLLFCTMCTAAYFSIHIYTFPHTGNTRYIGNTTVDNNSALCVLRLTLLPVLFCAMGNMKHIVNTTFFAFSAICAPFSAICSILYT
jgi:hypothetical protein